MDRHPQYFLVQYVDDTLRKEAVNIGVLLLMNGKVLTRFFSERNTGTIDTQVAAQKVRYPGVYKEWVDYWRNEAKDGMAGIERIIASTIGNFQVITGGEYFGDHRKPIELLHDVFGKVVVALDRARSEVGVRLSTSIKRELEQLNVVKRPGLKFAKHPIAFQQTFRGKAAPHTPTMSQVNGRHYFMQAVEFAKSESKQELHDRAAANAYMFADLKRTFPKCSTISIVGGESRLAQKNIDHALNMLRDQSQIVQWADEIERDQFLSERVAVAELESH